jgi:hypothetical protein
VETSSSNPCPTACSPTPIPARVGAPRPGDALVAARQRVLETPMSDPNPALIQELEIGGRVLVGNMAHMAGDRELEEACKDGRVRAQELFQNFLRLDQRNRSASRALRTIGRGPSRVRDVRHVRRARESRPGTRRRSSRRGGRTSRAGPSDSEGEPSPAGGHSRRFRVVRLRGGVS